MHRDGTWLCFANLAETPHNGLGRCAPVDKVKVVVLYARINEDLLLVDLLVESDHRRDTEFLKDGYVILWSQGDGAIISLEMFRGRAAEADEFSGDDFVEVSGFDLLIVVVFLVVECFKVEPPQDLSFVHGTEAVLHGEVECADPHCRVSEGCEGWVHVHAWRKGLVRGTAEVKNGVASNKHRTTSSLVSIRTGVEHNLLRCEVWMLQMVGYERGEEMV